MFVHLLSLPRKEFFLSLWDLSVTSTISFALFTYLIFWGCGGWGQWWCRVQDRHYMNTYIRSSYGQNIKLAYKQFISEGLTCPFLKILRSRKELEFQITWFCVLLLDLWDYLLTPFHETYSGQLFSFKSKPANPSSFISRFVKSSKCSVVIKITMWYARIRGRPCYNNNGEGSLRDNFKCESTLFFNILIVWLL